MSKPLQVYLDDAELERVDSWLRERGWTKSQLVRAALRAFLRTPESDPLLAASGMIDGLPREASTRFDDYLNQTYVAERPPAYRARRARTTRVRR